MNTSISVAAVRLVVAYEERLANILERTDNVDVKLVPMKASIALYGDLLKVKAGQMTFEKWLEITKSYYRNRDQLALDPEGKLENLADQYFKLDLRAHYEKYVYFTELDIEMIYIKRIVLQQNVITLLTQSKRN